MDNTWATPLYFRPLDHGVDLVIQAGTKYIGGHSDVMLGAVSANAAHVAALKQTTFLYGLCEGPDDVYLGLRGLRTLAVRLERHFKSGLEVARWLEQRPEVLRVLHPAMPSHPGPCAVAAGFFRRIGPVQHRAQAGAAEGGLRVPRCLTLFGIGPSWGGYESLAIPFDLRAGAHRDPVGAGRPYGAIPYRS